MTEQTRTKRSDRAAEAYRRFLEETTRPTQLAPAEVDAGADERLHPALVPGLAIEDAGHRFSLNRSVLAVAGGIALAMIAWGALAPHTLATVAGSALTWVTGNLGWLFGLGVAAIFVFMIYVGYSRYGRIPLGQDGEKPEFSTISWIAMLFSAGMGIGLLFYGPYEPTAYFLAPPPVFDTISPETSEAMHAALAQTLFHWGPLGWAGYALLGGAIGYSTYRRGRVGLVSALLEPIFGTRTKGPLGAVVDISAILVTLFGTAVSLGIGALQVGRGVEIIGGIGKVGNGVLVIIIAVLTALFLASAVSGLQRGIRLLSNINLTVAGLLGLFVFVAGPTLLILNVLPGALWSFADDFFAMLSQNGSMSPDAPEFMSTWTTYYWAWWVSWTPFVGTFIAKISRGRTIRQFVTVTLVAPAVVSLLWFGVFGATAMAQTAAGAEVYDGASPQDTLFNVLADLPLGAITSVVALISIIIFFVTSADSASLVMSGLSQRGAPEPKVGITALWGLALSATAVVLLLAGGSDALNGLQALVVVTAVPFLFVLALVMIAWMRDLRHDPYVLRRKVAAEAVRTAVVAGLEEHGSDFTFAAAPTQEGEGAGAWIDEEAPENTWYAEATEHAAEVAEDEAAAEAEAVVEAAAAEASDGVADDGVTGGDGSARV